MDFIRHGGRVDKDAAVSSEDEPLEKGLALTLLRNEFIGELLHKEHVSVEDWLDYAQVYHTSIPLSSFVLRQNSL